MPEFRASTELGFSESQLVNQLGTQINMAFQKIVRQAKGRPIWVPLSGGLDSRLIVSKLVEHGHDDLTTFSFGLKNNHEMVRARKVANTLGLKWIPAPSQVDRLSDLYLSPERRGYTDLAFNGQTTPVWLDFESVHWLVNSGRIPKDAIIINGYSGDFIFGGHIYNALLSSGTSRKIVDLLISKHCSHFKSKSLFGVTQQITDRILQQIDELLISGSDPAQLASFSEFWDWQERQVKAVVNGQRLYEFYGLDWRLPFWDRDLVEYCRTIPIDLRAEQKLHISYLKAYNFRGLFRDLRPSNQLWTPKWRWVPAIAKLIELTRGSKQKALFYEKMYFFGYHRFQLGLFGRQKYLQTHGSLRRPYVVPLATLAVLDELGLNYPTGLLVALDKKES